MDYTIILLILYIIGYAFTTYYQNKKINSYKESIEAMKSFLGIFDIEQVKKYVKLKDEAAQLEVAKKVGRIENELKGKISKLESKNKRFEQYSEEYMALIIQLLVKLNREQRHEFLQTVEGNYYRRAIGTAIEIIDTEFDREEEKINPEALEKEL